MTLNLICGLNPQVTHMMASENMFVYECRLNAEQVDIGDLTWEQKEKVLRHLFARINRCISTPAAATGKKLTSKPAEEQLQPSLMEREAWLAVLPM